MHDMKSYIKNILIIQLQAVFNNCLTDGDYLDTSMGTTISSIHQSESYLRIL